MGKQSMLQQIEKGNLLDVMADILKDNKYEFECGDSMYRIRQPLPKEKQEAYRKSMAFHIQLLEDDSQKTSEQLKQLYKKKGIDIDKIDKDILNLEKEKDKVSIELGELVVKEALEKDRLALEQKIADLNVQITVLRNQKIPLLQYSIENQTQDYYINYLTFSILEKQIEKDKKMVWRQVYSSYEKYESGDEKLITLGVLHSSLLVNQNAFNK